MTEPLHIAMMHNPEYLAAAFVVRRLRAEGHQAFFAGGCVRDLLLGVEAKDFDVATSARPDEVTELFAKTFNVGAHFGVVLVCERVKDHEVPGGEDVEVKTEVATFRSDGAYSDGRRPDAVRFSSDPKEDVLRRDFTINGMLLDPLKWEQTGNLDESVLDFVGGRDDLRAGIVRAIGDPVLRFTEDKLRMLRAVRFAARLEFAIEPATMRAMQALASTVNQVSCERIREELTRILTEGHARRGFELLDESGLLREVLPEVVRMHGVEQPPEYHPEGNVWVHTMLLLEKLPAGCSPTLAWGALLHDVGKPATYTPPSGPGDRIRFNGHVEVGVRVAEEILRRLRFSGDDAAQIVVLVHNHMRFGDVLHMKQSTLKRFLRLPKFDEHLQLHWMDASSAHGDLRLWEFAKKHYEDHTPEQVKPKLLVTGRELIAAGYEPGRFFKEMLAAAEDAQLEGAVQTTGEAMEFIRKNFGPPQWRAGDCCSRD